MSKSFILKPNRNNNNGDIKKQQYSILQYFSKTITIEKKELTKIK